MDEFDKTLLSTVDEILLYTIGDVGTQVIYNYLERNCFPKSEIPANLDRFSEELRNLLGDGKGQILGSAPILEEAIVEKLCVKLSMPAPRRLPMAFSIFIRKLKGTYFSKRKDPAISVIESAFTEEAELR